MEYFKTAVHGVNQMFVYDTRTSSTAVGAKGLEYHCPSQRPSTKSASHTPPEHAWKLLRFGGWRLLAGSSSFFAGLMREVLLRPRDK